MPDIDVNGHVLSGQRPDDPLGVRSHFQCSSEARRKPLKGFSECIVSGRIDLDRFVGGVNAQVGHSHVPSCVRRGQRHAIVSVAAFSIINSPAGGGSR